MGLLDRLKSALGLGPSDAAGVDSTPQAGDGVGVSVEHEPDTESEDAVKGTDTGGTETTDEPAGTDATEETDDTEPKGEASGTSTEEIKGIGPTYSDRLADAGIETVSDLADADPEDLAAETDISETRLETWVKRARNR